MRLDRLLADAEPPRDLLVLEPRADEREHLALTFGELGRGSALASCAEHRAGRFRGERRLAARRSADRRHELVRLRVLEQVADGAGVERLQDALPVRERREDDDGGFCRLAEEPTGRLDAVEARHLEIHQHDVGFSLSRDAHSLVAVGGDADYLDAVGRPQEVLEPSPHHGVVVRQQHADHGDGTSSVTRVPEPGSESTSRDPPALAARSASSDRPTCPSRRRRSAS
jgi:hypothetical protein